MLLRDLVARGVVTLSHVKGTLMLADLLTKAQARPVFLELMRLLDEYTHVTMHRRAGVAALVQPLVGLSFFC